MDTVARVFSLLNLWSSLAAVITLSFVAHCLCPLSFTVVCDPKRLGKFSQLKIKLIDFDCLTFIWKTYQHHRHYYQNYHHLLQSYVCTENIHILDQYPSKYVFTYGAVRKQDFWNFRNWIFPASLQF